MVQDSQVRLFLIQFKAAIAGGRFYVVPREKNNDFLASQGMTPKEREEVLLELQTSDYYAGPEEDKDYPGEKDIWKFKKRYLGVGIYIKVKLSSIEGGFYAKCLSFHD